MTATAQNTVTGGKAIVLGMTVLVFAMMAVVAQLPMPMQDSLLAEGGPFETLSVVGYGLCILLMFVPRGFGGASVVLCGVHGPVRGPRTGP